MQVNVPKNGILPLKIRFYCIRFKRIFAIFSKPFFFSHSQKERGFKRNIQTFKKVCRFSIFHIWLSEIKCINVDQWKITHEMMYIPFESEISSIVAGFRFDSYLKLCYRINHSFETLFFCTHLFRSEWIIRLQCRCCYAFISDLYWFDYASSTSFRLSCGWILTAKLCISVAHTRTHKSTHTLEWIRLKSTFLLESFVRRFSRMHIISSLPICLFLCMFVCQLDLSIHIKISWT